MTKKRAIHTEASRSRPGLPGRGGGALLAGLVFLSAASAAQGQAPQATAFAELFAEWGPISVTVREEALIIVLPMREVGEQDYAGLVASGLCLGASASLVDLAALRSVVVMNRARRQGWVLSSPGRVCVAMNALSLAEWLNPNDRTALLLPPSRRVECDTAGGLPDALEPAFTGCQGGEGR